MLICERHFMKYHVEFNLELKRNPYKGLYIALEGIDGSGKSTQVKALANHFKSLGKKVVITSEPTRDLVIGKLIRNILHAKVKVPAKAFQFIYSADRVINHETIVAPALKRGDVVISHRTFWSALSHGIVDRGQQKLAIETFAPILTSQGILSYYHQFIVADYTFYLDVSVETAFARINRMEKLADIYENKKKLAKVIKGYKWVVANFHKHITMVDGEKDTKEITQEIIKKII